VLDALTHAGIWRDDGQIDDLRIWRSRQHPGGQLILTITPISVVQPSLLGVM
jgi:Holliday junction resolvase RusA-like endonuclease